jgi:hypothetical protein
MMDIQIYGYRSIIFLSKKEFILEAGATKRRDLRLEVRRIRSRASRDRHTNLVWLDFKAPHRHLVDVCHLVDVTVTSARTNTNVPHIGVRPPFPRNRALGAQ